MSSGYDIDILDDVSTRLAGNVRRLREERGLSQKALAEHSGVPRPTIAHLESGQANPTLSVVMRVAGALGIGVDGLLDPGEAPVVVLTSKTLPSQRTSRVRRVQLVAPGNLRDGELERIVFKASGRLTLTPPSGAFDAVVSERGEFLVKAGPLELTLSKEQVALVRAPAEFVSMDGGVLYRAAGRPS